MEINNNIAVKTNPLNSQKVSAAKAVQFAEIFKTGHKTQAQRTAQTGRRHTDTTHPAALTSGTDQPQPCG